MQNRPKTEEGSKAIDEDYFAALLKSIFDNASSTASETDGKKEDETITPNPLIQLEIWKRLIKEIMQLEHTLQIAHMMQGDLEKKLAASGVEASAIQIMPGVLTMHIKMKASLFAPPPANAGNQAAANQENVDRDKTVRTPRMGSSSSVE